MREIAKHGEIGGVLCVGVNPATARHRVGHHPFVALTRGRDCESQIVQSFECFLFLSARALFVVLRIALRRFLFREFVADGVQFAFQLSHALIGCLNLLLECRLFCFEVVDLALGLFLFRFQQ